MKNVASIILTALAVVGFTLVRSGSNSAVKYNNEIIKLQNMVIEKMFDLAKSFEQNPRSPEVMRQRLRELQNQTTASADAVSELGDFKGNTDLRDTALQLFEFYESVCNDEYVTIVEILSKSDNDITNEDYNTILAIQRQIEKEEMKIDIRMKQVQQQFANEHNFQIKANKYQEKIDGM